MPDDVWRTPDELRFINGLGWHVPRLDQMTPERRHRRRLLLLQCYLRLAPFRRWPEDLDHELVLARAQDLLEELDSACAEPGKSV